METAEVIQTGILIATSLGVLIAMVFGIDQVKKQNKMLRAQLVKDIFDMYQSSEQDISHDLVSSFDQYHFEYMDTDLYQKEYRGKKERIRKYIWLSEHYEMLAFAYSIRDMLKDQVINEGWIEKWLRDLKQHQEFNDVRAMYGPYYKDFDGIVSRASKNSTLHELSVKKGKKA
ncbi:MAG: hypothetical protein MUC88_27775 [Planctomycetes bacterium]|jgi:hypothetical protein|nr:hypothetical protein [Planctomycetota bacterium]